MTFHSDFWSNGKLNVAPSCLDGHTEIGEYQVDLNNPNWPWDRARIVRAIPQALTNFGKYGDGSIYVVGIDDSVKRISGGTATGQLDGGDRIKPIVGDDHVYAGAERSRLSTATGLTQSLERFS